MRLADDRVVRPIGPRRGVVKHDVLVQPTIRTMRAQGEIQRAIADGLEAEGVMSAGRRDTHIRAGGWTATATWGIGKLHGIASFWRASYPLLSRPSLPGCTAILWEAGGLWGGSGAAMKTRHPASSR